MLNRWYQLLGLSVTQKQSDNAPTFFETRLQSSCSWSNKALSRARIVIVNSNPCSTKTTECPQYTHIPMQTYIMNSWASCWSKPASECAKVWSWPILRERCKQEFWGCKYNVWNAREYKPSKLLLTLTIAFLIAFKEQEGQYGCAYCHAFVLFAVWCMVNWNYLPISRTASNYQATGRDNAFVHVPVATLGL